MLLSREDAIRVFEASFPENKRYTVGYFYPLQWYLDELKSAGFEVEILDEVVAQGTPWKQMVDRQQDLSNRLEDIAGGDNWPEWRKTLIGEHLDSHLSRFESDMKTMTDRTALMLRYGVAVYHLRCTRVQ